MRPTLPDDVAVRVDNFLQPGHVDFVRVIERPHDEQVAEQAHDRQQDRADDREAQDAAEHDVARPHRLGDDRVDRLWS